MPPQPSQDALAPAPPCPVETNAPDRACAPSAVPDAEIVATLPDEVEIRARSGRDGAFRIAVPPDEVTITFAAVEGLMMAPGAIRATVESNEPSTSSTCAMPLGSAGKAGPRLSPGGPAPPSQETALCHSCVDTQARRIYDERYAIRLSRLDLSAKNRRIARRLLEEGRMTAAGVAGLVPVGAAPLTVTTEHLCGSRDDRGDYDRLMGQRLNRPRLGGGSGTCFAGDHAG
jgi:hypothetical protein